MGQWVMWFRAMEENHHLTIPFPMKFRQQFYAVKAIGGRQSYRYTNRQGEKLVQERDFFLSI